MPNSDDKVKIECIQAASEIFYKEPQLVIKAY